MTIQEYVYEKNSDHMLGDFVITKNFTTKNIDTDLISTYEDYEACINAISEDNSFYKRTLDYLKFLYDDCQNILNSGSLSEEKAEQLEDIMFKVEHVFNQYYNLFIKLEGSEFVLRRFYNKYKNNDVYTDQSDINKLLIDFDQDRKTVVKYLRLYQSDIVNDVLVNVKEFKKANGITNAEIDIEEEPIM